MTMIIHKFQLEKFPRRFRDAVIAAGRVNGEEVAIEGCQYESLRQRHMVSFRRRGLGGWVEWLISPVVWASDKFLGTKLKACSACARRRNRLDWIGWHIGQIGGLMLGRKRKRPQVNALRKPQ